MSAFDKLLADIGLLNNDIVYYPDILKKTPKTPMMLFLVQVKMVEQ